MKRKTGDYEKTTVAGEEVSAFVPYQLPPKNPPLELSDNLRGKLAKAEHSLARLALAGEMVPSLDWFIYGFVRKEAVLSSQIEGTQATLIDLLAFEAESGAHVANADVEEVCNYLDALNFAREQLRSETGLPISMRLLNEAHRRLMNGARGATKQPGEIRTTQNWIGGMRPGTARFVPPPPHKLNEVLSDFEKYIHSNDQLPSLIRAGLLHVQLETIHPYLDGNGRIGRLLITLLFEHWKILSEPLLYLSVFFKRHRDEYYLRLNSVRTDGDWEGWVGYFLEGVATTSEEAVKTSRDLFDTVSRDRERALASEGITVLGVKLFELLPKHPLISVNSVMKLLGTSKPAAGRAINSLMDAGILKEITGKKRDRQWSYEGYLVHLGAETDAPI